MAEAQATFGLATRIFWSVLWRSFVIGIPVIFLVGIATAAIFSHLGNDGANTAARIATFVAMIPVQIVCIQLVIGKRYGKLRLTLVHNSTDADV